MAVPKDVTIAVVESELPAAEAYARRHGWRLAWLKDERVLLADWKHPVDQTPLRLRADLVDYRALPPAWTCFQLDADGAAKLRFPKPGTLPGNASSIYGSARVICAPFNRLAYKEHAGPHGDWGGPAAWLTVRGNVTAFVLADMLAQMLVHLTYSPGWH